jgi:adenine phosphoribosyltransferase
MSISSEDAKKLQGLIRIVPDFPIKGIQFQDISTLCANPWGMKKTIETFAAHYKGQKIDYVAGFESRGFIFGAALATELNCGFTMIRKPGKL